MTKMIESLNTSFLAEVQAKDDVLTTTRTYLKAAIVLLAATRREQAEMERQLSDLDEIEQRIQNVERALEHENNAAADWGLAPFASSSAANRKVEVARRGGEGLAEEVRELRKLAGWDRKVEAMLDARIRDIHGESVEKAVRFKKVIAICSGVPLEMVESVSSAV
jgi:regulatory protein SWI6